MEEIKIDEYLYGVVSSEMPASFEIEALKAQAVAARTYTIYKINNNDKSTEKRIYVIILHVVKPGYQKKIDYKNGMNKVEMSIGLK